MTHCIKAKIFIHYYLLLKVTLGISGHNNFLIALLTCYCKFEQIHKTRLRNLILYYSIFIGVTSKNNSQSTKSFMNKKCNQHALLIWNVQCWFDYCFYSPNQKSSWRLSKYLNVYIIILMSCICLISNTNQTVETIQLKL